MRRRLFFSCFFTWFVLSAGAYAQSILGVVIDNVSKKPINEVNIDNTYTGFTMLTDQQGKFFITASKGQLLEFRKPGYKTVHVRIPEGDIPPYFKIIMQAGPVVLAPYVAANKYTADSLRNRQLYAHELDVPKLSAFGSIEHPFSALSKKNQEIWAFQDDYYATEQQKFVDSKFNPELITQLTGLAGDSLTYYMRRYRPTYEQARGMSEYGFYNYIKHAAGLYRSRGTYRISR
jgi:hypothetical protein